MWTGFADLISSGRSFQNLAVRGKSKDTFTLIYEHMHSFEINKILFSRGREQKDHLT